MAYILDIVVILIFLLAIFLGYRRGFFKSVIQLVGCIAAVLIAVGLSAPLAGGIYDQFFSKAVEERITVQMKELGTSSMGTTLDEVLEELPGPVRSALSLFNLSTPESIQDRLSDSLDGTAENAARSLEQKIVRPVATSLLRVLCFFILFIVLMIGVWIAAAMVGRVFRLPALRQVDGTLGAILGAVQGVVFVFVAVSVMSLMATSSDDGKVTRATMNDTLLVRTVEKANPVTNTLYSMFGADFV